LYCRRKEQDLPPLFQHYARVTRWLRGPTKSATRTIFEQKANSRQFFFAVEIGEPLEVAPFFKHHPGTTIWGGVSSEDDPTSIFDLGQIVPPGKWWQPTRQLAMQPTRRFQRWEPISYLRPPSLSLAPPRAPPHRLFFFELGLPWKWPFGLFDLELLPCFDGLMA